MATVFNKINIAKRVCELLTDKKHEVATVILRSQLGLEKNDNWPLLQVLKGLRARGVLSQRGEGKFYWKLVNPNYNKENPFKTEPVKVEQAIAELQVPTSFPAPVIGHTFPFKDQLRVMDCVWEKEPHKAWMAPNLMVWKMAQALIAGGDPNKVPVETPPEATTPKQPSFTDALIADIAGLRMTVTDLTAEKDNLALELKVANELLEKANSKGGRKIETLIVKSHHDQKELAKLKNVMLPANFDKVMSLAVARRNILLVGPAGAGKTFLAKLVSKALGLKFGSISCSSGMNESQLTGRSIPNFTTGESVFQTTEFLERFEFGGVMAIDEMDASDPNVMLVINSAIGNGYCNVPARPDKPHAIRHKDFILIGTANTFGRGANRMYAGRNQLDEATIDRFRIGIVETYYDEAVEEELCPNVELRTRLTAIRKKIEESGLRRVMSTRFMIDAYEMVKSQSWTVDQVLETFFQGWTADELAKVA